MSSFVLSLNSSVLNRTGINWGFGRGGGNKSLEGELLIFKFIFLNYALKNLFFLSSVLSKHTTNYTLNKTHHRLPWKQQSA